MVSHGSGLWRQVSLWNLYWDTTAMTDHLSWRTTKSCHKIGHFNAIEPVPKDHLPWETIFFNGRWQWSLKAGSAVVPGQYGCPVLADHYCWPPRCRLGLDLSAWHWMYCHSSAGTYRTQGIGRLDTRTAWQSDNLHSMYYSAIAVYSNINSVFHNTVVFILTGGNTVQNIFLMNECSNHIMSRYLAFDKTMRPQTYRNEDLLTQPMSKLNPLSLNNLTFDLLNNWTQNELDSRLLCNAMGHPSWLKSTNHK